MRAALSSVLVCAIATTLLPTAASAARNGKFLNAQRVALQARNKQLAGEKRALAQKVYEHEKKDLEAEVTQATALVKDRQKGTRFLTGMGGLWLLATALEAHYSQPAAGAHMILGLQAAGGATLLGLGAVSAKSKKTVTRTAEN